MTTKEFIFQTYKDSSPEFVMKIMSNWRLRPERNYNGELVNPLDLPFAKTKWVVYDVVMGLISKGDRIRLNTPDDLNLHNKECIIEKKTGNYIHVCINDNSTWKINAFEIVYLCKEEKMNVKIGDLVCIKTGSMRPGYSADSLFKVVWKSAVNVRVEPINPKYPQEIISKHEVEWKTKDRPGSYIREFTDSTKKRYFKKSVYQLDIPKSFLVAPDQYDKEDLELVMDLHDIGF